MIELFYEGVRSFSARFDWSVIILFNLGIWLFFYYSEIQKYKKQIAPIVGAVISSIYVAVYNTLLSTGEGDVVNILNVINSYLLSNFLYVIGLRNVFDWLEKHMPSKAVKHVSDFVEEVKSEEIVQAVVESNDK